MTPLCFVLMPFGRKPAEGGREIDFDAVYEQIIAPAIRLAEMDPLRADEEAFGGIIHKAMFERLMLCDYAVADLTTANANVFYELGVRHGIRPRSTVLIHGLGGRVPFDVGLLRHMPYRLDSMGCPANAAEDADRLAAVLRQAREPVTDSPLFELLTGLKAPDIARLKTDHFREKTAQVNGIRRQIAQARQQEDVAGLAAIEQALPDFRDLEPALLIDLLLSYRAVSNHTAMVSLVERLPQEIASTILVQEQYGFALNRLGRHGDAERVLTGVIGQHGPSSESNGLLGRVYKDQWQAACKGGQDVQAEGYRKKAVAAYLQGFESDWRDAYPGINALTLMALGPQQDRRFSDLLPVVRYAVERRLAKRTPDYWDYATVLELAVLADDPAAAQDALSDALAHLREPWEAKSTAGNLSLLADARLRHGGGGPWLRGIIGCLLDKAGA